jgi:hypothetical protein
MRPKDGYVLALCASLLQPSTARAISAIVVRNSASSRASTAGAVASRRTAGIWAPPASLRSRSPLSVGFRLRRRRNAYRASSISDRAATQVFRTLAVGRQAAAREPPAAADEAPAARPAAAAAREPPAAADEAPAARPAAAAREPAAAADEAPAARPAAAAREPAAARDEAREGPPRAQGGLA